MANNIVLDKLGFPSEGLVRKASSVVSTLSNMVTDIDIRFFDPDYWRLSKLGTPTMGWIQLYWNDESQVESLSDTFNSSFKSESVTLDEVLISVSQSHRIVETYVKGAITSFKEYLGAGDLNITVTGKFVGSFPNFTDTLNIEKFFEVAQKGISLIVVNPELNILYDVTKVVIYSITIDQNPDFNNVRNFSIELKSDSDFVVQ